LTHTEKCENCNEFATCEVQHETGGECCTCRDGYSGNGKYCFKESKLRTIFENSQFFSKFLYKKFIFQKDEPVVVKGKIVGTLNNIKLANLDIYSYIITHSSDPRSFVTIGKVPVELGGSLQSLINVISPINWLFAGRIENSDESVKARNGFATTGGAFSRQTSLRFSNEESGVTTEVAINQEFYGYDLASNDIYVHTEISGEVPSVGPDSQVVFKDYKLEFTQETGGVVRSSGELEFKVTSTTNSQAFETYRVAYVDEITYSECPFLTTEAASESNVRVSSKRVYVTYTRGDGLVRFTSSNYLYPIESSDDPCQGNTCNVYAECVTDLEQAGNYTCLCKVGFEGNGYDCYG
jgi:hypothetical protein